MVLEVIHGDWGQKAAFANAVVTLPDTSEISPSRSFSKVDFPEATGPATIVVLLRAISKFKLLRTAFPVAEYATVTFVKFNAEWDPRELRLICEELEASRGIIS
jgi:hypothetical protein